VSLHGISVLWWLLLLGLLLLLLLTGLLLLWRLPPLLLHHLQDLPQQQGFNLHSEDLRKGLRSTKLEKTASKQLSTEQDTITACCTPQQAAGGAHDFWTRICRHQARQPKRVWLQPAT